MDEIVVVERGDKNCTSMRISRHQKNFFAQLSEHESRQRMCIYVSENFVALCNVDSNYHAGV